MTMLSYAFRWLPFPLLAAMCLQDLGWWRAGIVLFVFLVVPEHWIFASLASVAGVVWLDIPGRYLIWAAAYRLVWDLGLRTFFTRLIRKRRRRRYLTRVVPHLRCGHGLSARIRAADRLTSVGLADAATDAYLQILADHPVEPSCGRVLLLRAAEAARAAGDHILAAELSGAALRGVPQDPTGRLATIAVRAHATRTAALAGLGDVDEAARSLRRAQRLTQRSRATERHLRWTAAEVRLAARQFRTADEFVHEISGALSEQNLSPREIARLNRLTVMMAWRLVVGGDAEGAARVFYSVRRDLDLDPAGTGIRRPDGRFRVPAEHQPAWRLFTLAVAGEVAAAAARDEELSGDDRAAADLATNLAWYFDENLTGARMLLTWALVDHRHGGDPKDAVAKLQRAQRFADLGLHTFADSRSQDEWIRLRQEIAAALYACSGTEEPPVTSPWPATPQARDQAEKARAQAEALFDRLAANDPEAFGPARQRVVSRLEADLDDAALRALWGPPTDAVAASGNTPASSTDIPTAPADTPVAQSEAVVPASPLPADPEWLPALMAAARDRCWMLVLAVDQARALGHGHVGPEHVLLAVARDGACGEILAGLGVTADDLQTTVGSWYARTETTAPVLDSEVSALVRRAAALAGALGESRVQAAHLLIALLAKPHGIGGAVLRTHGVELGEARVRLDAALTAPALQGRAGPLFAAGEIVHDHRLTLPAWLAIGWALDLASTSSGRILGADHLVAGVEAYEEKAPPTFAPDRRSTVRIDFPAREILATARHDADAASEWGIDLDHLRRAIRQQPPPADPPAGPDTRAVCDWVARRGAHFVTPEDLSGAPSQEDPPSNVFSPVPVLTPAARRARERDWSAV
ncbi:MAG: Clp protease N-terminal domain-containing protein [Catenulispora sp.]